MDNQKKIPNRLIREKSPYLLQHAYNPVDWYPWGVEAFEKAKLEDKPVFLSIGYSACHWCHVMEKESFEKEDVAKFMNNAFINIKVDREERPDVDHVYMSVCQVLTGSGGWPLTIIMTPDQKPFFAGTYIPRRSQYGRMGMIELIPRIQELWQKKRKKVLDSSDEIRSLLEKDEERKWNQKIVQDTSENETIKDIFQKTFEELEYSFDNEKGGFGGAPKFPTPHRLSFLLRHWRETGNVDALDMVNKTLLHMRMGGIFDQIGFGFHRYSTDSNWLLPHFEKMLYDQALMAKVYMEAYQATKEEVYKETAQQVLEYVFKNLLDRGGAFYCAEDADSEGEEGKFYLWTEEELDHLLKENSHYAKNYFGVEKQGNYHEEATKERTGKNILYLDKEEKLLLIDKDKIREIRELLFKEREKRIRPALDDKILVDWNGFMIAAFAMAGRVFDKKEYIQTSKRACDFFLESIKENGELLHRYGKGKWDIKAHIDDYAFFIEGLIELYQSTFDEKYREKAVELTEEAIRQFWDHKGAGFYFTSIDGEQLILRKKEIYDGAIPSANSIMLLNLLKLSAITETENLSQKANEMIHYFMDEVEQHPTAYTQMVCGFYYAYGNSGEITVTGGMDNPQTRQMVTNLSQEYLPHMLLKGDQNSSKATVTLCMNKTCGQPTTDVNELLQTITR